MAVYVLPPPSHFSNRTFISATEVIDEVSSATVRTFSIGTLLTSRIERTARREAIATSGSTCNPGISAYAAAGMMPMSAVPSAKRASASRGQGVGNIEVAPGVSMFEIPHQGGGIEVRNGGNT